MKLLRKLIGTKEILEEMEATQQKIDHILENSDLEETETEPEMSSEEKESINVSIMNEQDLEELKNDIKENSKKIPFKQTAKELWELSLGTRKRLPYLFALVMINSLMGLMSVGLILPLTLLIQNRSYITTDIDISDFSIARKLMIEFARFVYDIFNLQSAEALIFVLGLGFLVMFVFKNIFGIFVEYKISRYSMEINKHFNQKLFAVLMYISYTYSLGREPSRTFYALGLSGQCSNMIISLFNTVNDLLLMLFLSIGILFLTPIVSALGIVILFICWSIYRFSKNELRFLAVCQYALGKQSSKNVYQSINNFVFSRLCHAEAYFIKHYHDLLNKSLPLGAYRSIIASLPRVTIELLFVLAFMGYTVITLFYSSTAAEDIVTTAAFLAAAVMRLMPASLRLTGFLSTFTGDQIAINKFYHEYKTAQLYSIDQRPKEEVAALEFTQKLEVKNVSFAYPEFDISGTKLSYKRSPVIIKDLSFTIKKGEKIGIVGGSGGGKTTLMYLLMAFLEPQSGGIYVDNVDINQQMRAWQKNIGYVPQESMLMSGTVLDNIAFAMNREDISEEQVIKSLKSAHLWDVVKNLPKGVYTNIGDLGKRLSGGQKQRLGIARALYRNPKIIFFDEATSHLDRKTEKEVQKAIDDLDKDITAIIIAHRINTLENCDRIIQIENGELKFEGPYKELIKIMQ